MKKLLFLIIVSIQTLGGFSVKAQVLTVNNNEQLYNEWCWAGCSKTILDYYGFSTIQQCDIAEYTRTTATFNNFGSVACCVDATQGCNYWNYNYGSAGSIQDILIHFGNIQNTGMANALTLAEITTEIQNNRLFVIRWGWSGGGGHFIVGHGVSGNNVYFMNPWFGEGLHIGTYNFMLSGVDNTSTDTHTWTHTNTITASTTTSLNELKNSNQNGISVYPNPSTGNFIIETNATTKQSIQVYDIDGRLVLTQNIIGKTSIDANSLRAGIYNVSIIGNKGVVNQRIIIAK
ncbi:MAG: T9SS type A sorting domain-containing protein [Bacteroidia bacterium]